MCKFRTLSIQIDHLLITIVFIIQQRQYLYKVKKGAMNDDFVGFVRLIYAMHINLYNVGQSQDHKKFPRVQH